MTSSLPIDDVAEDYKNSLEDLTLNSRYEISNLTVIAKESIDHALSITRVIENHIRTIPPNRKLPALYVLDSVAKNVGAPYTLLFGRNLFRTFMNAYTLLDGPTRRKLEEMLKTWKEPVPGSIDSRPVFPTEVTRPIDNALLKARIAVLNVQQQQAQSQQALSKRRPGTGTPPVPYRNTPTPPTNGSRYLPPSNLQQNGHPYIPPQPSTYDAYKPPQQPHQVYQPYPPPYQQVGGSFDSLALSMDTLGADIGALVAATKDEFARNLYDTGVQQRLKALLDLQSIVQSQQLPPDQLRLIRDQVAQLSAAGKQPVMSIPTPTLPYMPPAPLQAPPPQPTAQQSLFPPGALESLLAATNVASNITPPPRPASQGHSSFSAQLAASGSTSVGQESSLMAALRAAGMVPPVTSSPVPAPALPVNVPYPNSLPQMTSFATPPQLSATPISSGYTPAQNDTQMTSASLKIPRPHLISLLYEQYPNQCSTCGRRFQATEEGKRKKANHLDWHFRVNQRMQDAMKRGQNRSWYVGEVEWIKSRDGQEDSIEGSNNGAANGSLLASAAVKKQPKKQYILKPNDPAMANLHCPICQEKFETVWLEEVQDFVWMDAIKVGDRIYHASCHEEATKDRAATPLRDLTPDSILGKRKADGYDLNVMKAKVKREDLV